MHSRSHGRTQNKERYSLDMHIDNIYHSCRFIPESFRWLFTKARYDDAELVIDKVARMNGRQKPDISKIIDQAKLEEKEKQYYSAVDLFKTKDSVIKTLALLFIW